MTGPPGKRSGPDEDQGRSATSPNSTLRIAPDAAPAGKYQVMPPLDPADRAALRASIAAEGMLVPVDVDEAGDILDGHHRREIWAELRAEGTVSGDYPVRTVGRLDGDEAKRAYALRVNLARRHLSRQARDKIVAGLRAEGWSVRRISAATGLPKTTVHRAAPPVPNGTPEPEAEDKRLKRSLNELFRVTGLPPEVEEAQRRAAGAPPRVTGKDGKSYPASRPEREPVSPRIARIIELERSADEMEARADEMEARAKEKRAQAEEAQSTAKEAAARQEEPARPPYPGSLTEAIWELLAPFGFEGKHQPPLSIRLDDHGHSLDINSWTATVPQRDRGKAQATRDHLVTLAGDLQVLAKVIDRALAEPKPARKAKR